MFAALLLAGCAQTQRRETIKQVCLADANQAALMEAAQNTTAGRAVLRTLAE
jgi:hypothetical protein